VPTVSTERVNAKRAAKGKGSEIDKSTECNRNSLQGKPPVSQKDQHPQQINRDSGLFNVALFFHFPYENIENFRNVAWRSNFL